MLWALAARQRQLFLSTGVLSCPVQSGVTEGPELLPSSQVPSLGEGKHHSPLTLTTAFNATVQKLAD